MTELLIASRFCGPPTSGNGGYSSGRLAAFIEGPAEVTLRAPPPLDTQLRVEKESGAAKLWHGEQLIAEAKSADPSTVLGTGFTLEVPAPPTWEEAQVASKRYAGHQRHDYGTCFVCGPQRGPGDGLRIFCGPWKDGVVAGPWLPDASLDDGKGWVKPEFLWAAIDCPGSWSVIGVDSAQDAPPSSVLLGRLTGRLVRPVRTSEQCIAIGWPLGREGRKFHVGSAIYTRSRTSDNKHVNGKRSGELVAYSRGTWIALKA